MTLELDLTAKAAEWLAKWHASGDQDQYAKGVSDAYTDAARMAAKKGV